MCVQPILTITHLQNENGYDIDFQIGALIMSMQKLVTPRGWAKVDCSYRTTVPALNCESFTNSIYMHTLCIPAMLCQRNCTRIFRHNYACIRTTRINQYSSGIQPNNQTLIWAYMYTCTCKASIFVGTLNSG